MVRQTVLALGAVLGMSGGGVLPPAPVPASADVVPPAVPALSTDLGFESERSMLGTGSVRMSAAPAQDMLHVSILVGALTSRTHWGRCADLRLNIDERAVVVPVFGAPVPVEQGVFDAASAELRIDDVREMITATTVAIELCGDTIELSQQERAALGVFVERFEDLASKAGEGSAEPPLELHEWRSFEPDFGSYPV